MKAIFGAGLAVLAMGFNGGTSAQEGYTPPPLEAFGQMPTLRDVKVSPSGDRFFTLIRPAGAADYKFAVFENSPQGLAPLFVTEQTGEFRFRKPFWKRDDRIVFSTASNGLRDGVETVETRLFSLDPESGDSAALFRMRPKNSRLDMQNEVPVQIQDDIVSTLPNDPDYILVEYFDEGLNNVYRVFVNSGRSHVRALRGKEGVTSWDADSTGRIRGGFGILYNTKQKLIVRMPDDSWVDISHRVNDEGTSFELLGFPHDPTKAYVASNHETDTNALYLYDIPTDTIGEQIFHSPSSDVYGIVQQRSDGSVIGVNFAGDDVETHWLGTSFVREVTQKVVGALPGKTVSVRSLNPTDTHSVHYAEDGNNPGQYFIFDHEKNHLTALPAQYPNLAGVPMGQTVSTTYTARDGLEIPAFVTLPPWLGGLEDAGDLPFVVLPHGGPNARTFTGFDWEVQFLVSRGYGVLQMNFRGSAGYGQAFLEAGDREWGQAMQDDITDGAHWLIDQGYADKDRLVILGHSYGGYAALMGAAKTPDLYQCAIAHAPVTDLPRLIRHENQFVGGKYWTRQIGRLWQEGGKLRENSPAQRAEDINIPVLLFHGENDRVVIIEQSNLMASALKRANRDYEYIVLEEGSHFLDVGENRLVFLRKTADFIDKCVGN